MRAPPAVLLLVLALAAGATGQIQRSTVERDAHKLIRLTSAFGFSRNIGKMDITIKDIAIYRLHDDMNSFLDLDNFAFFLSPLPAEDLVIRGCILDYVDSKLFTFKDSSIQNIIYNQINNFTFHFVVNTGPYSEELIRQSLYFVNCEQKLTPVSFDTYIDMYNVDENGSKNYSLGETVGGTVGGTVGETVSEAVLDLVYWLLQRVTPRPLLPYLPGPRPMVKPIKSRPLKLL